MSSEERPDKLENKVNKLEEEKSKLETKVNILEKQTTQAQPKNFFVYRDCIESIQHKIKEDIYSKKPFV